MISFFKVARNTLNRFCGVYGHHNQGKSAGFNPPVVSLATLNSRFGRFCGGDSYPLYRYLPWVYSIIGWFQR